MSLFPVSPNHSPKPARHRTGVPAERGKYWLAMLSVVAVTLIALGRITTHSFLSWDDDKNIYQNPHLTSLGYCWAHPVENLYIPLTYTVWGLLAFVAGGTSGGGAELNPSVFHIASLVFHIVAAIGVLLALRRLGLRLWPAAFGALVFAVHPLQAETVAWATGLRDILSGGLCIWAIWFYLGATDAQQRTKRRWTESSLATLLFIAAMLSKPQAVCLPLVLASIEIFRRPRAWRRWLWHLLPWLVLTLPIILITRSLQPAVAQGMAAPPVIRPLIASDDLLFYIEKLIVPIDLTVDYAHTTQRLLQDGSHIALWLVLPAILVLLYYLRRRLPWLVIGMAIFVCALLPVLGFVPFDYQRYSNVANHYAYLAMLGPALIGACALQAAMDYGVRKFVAGGVGGLLVILMAAATFNEAGDWNDEFTLFNRNLHLQPDSFVANVHMGTYWSKEGRVDEAVTLYRHALTIKPADPEARFDLANALNRQGRLADAVAEYRLALRVWPDRAELHENLGVTLAREGKIDEAAEELQTANRLQPGNPQVLLDLAKTSKDMQTAKAYLAQALAANPNLTEARAMLQQIENMPQPKPRQ